MAGMFPMRSVLPRLKHQSQEGTRITSSCEKQCGFCLPRKNSWTHKEPLKGLRDKTSFVVTYPGLWEKEGIVEGIVVWIRHN